MVFNREPILIGIHNRVNMYSKNIGSNLLLGILIIKLMLL